MSEFLSRFSIYDFDPFYVQGTSMVRTDSTARSCQAPFCLSFCHFSQLTILIHFMSRVPAWCVLISTARWYQAPFCLSFCHFSQFTISIHFMSTVPAWCVLILQPGMEHTDTYPEALHGNDPNPSSHKGHLARE